MTSSMNFSAVKSALVALSLVATTLTATAANAGGFSFGFSVGHDRGMMVDGGFAVGDPMGYPLIADDREEGGSIRIEVGGPTLHLGGIKIDPRQDAQRAHDCRLLKEAEAELKLIRKHWNKAFNDYAPGKTRDETLRMDEEAIERWTKIVKEYRERCRG
jgi:hypothetical protein